MNAITVGAAAWRPALTVSGLTVLRGGRPVLSGISTAFAEGAITAVVGPSGVGKTTLMSVLNGLVPPQAGEVAVAGLGGLGEPGVLREMRRRTATVFQDHALIGRLPAIDNVLLGLSDTRHPLSPLPWPRAARERAALALADVGLLARATARTDTLSGGERQRVGIARALVRGPRLILGDEPFASVDPALARRLGDELRRLVARDGLTAVLVLHQLQLARVLADRIVGLAGGRVAFDGPARAFDAAAEAAIFSAPAPDGDRAPSPENP
ncbi:ATP-binding cassette domain-containing protein [Xanthobacter sp. V2C-8]|uniref:phosphonate ABC transporter ATP-binding protein n=1 Tax=Xanthobacter albus TaxID=3119929 RepID=UPI00372B36B5